MKKVNEEKEKINKYLDNGEEPVRHEGPLSEGKYFVYSMNFKQMY